MRLSLLLHQLTSRLQSQHPVISANAMQLVYVTRNILQTEIPSAA